MTSTLRGGESAFTAKRSLRPACLLRGLFLHVVTLLFLLPCLGNATGVPVRSLRGLASTPLNRWNWPRRSPLAPTRDVGPAGGAGSTKTANTSGKQDSGSASSTSISTTNSATGHGGAKKHNPHGAFVTGATGLFSTWYLVGGGRDVTKNSAGPVGGK